MFSIFNFLVLNFFIKIIIFKINYGHQSLNKKSPIQTVYAIVYNPLTTEKFTAEKGKGAFLDGKKIAVSDVKGFQIVYTLNSSKTM